MTVVESSFDEKNIQDDDFIFFQNLVLKLAGIYLSEKKRDLLKTRLGPYLRNSHFKNYGEYRDYLEGLKENHPEWQSLINLLTTNKTDFFREPAHFEFIEEVLIPLWIKAQKKEIHIWSAACSSGEEPYTLAMFLEKKLPSGINYKILATDIDTVILKKAENGVYPISKQAEIPEDFRGHSIDYGNHEVADWFRIKQSLKKKITFKNHNLIEDKLPQEQLFDLVLCRNVMIYFPKEIVGMVATKLYRATLQEGYLFIGHSESLQASKTAWTSAAPSIYRKSLIKKAK